MIQKEKERENQLREAARLKLQKSQAVEEDEGDDDEEIELDEEALKILEKHPQIYGILEKLEEYKVPEKYKHNICL